MTLRVYRLAPDGTRTELASAEVAAFEPDGSRFLPEQRCRCRRCTADGSVVATAEEVA
ncbi:hypothetical protein ACFW1A_28060 [Kitasatospora sp. NPDC058965]|uniref:hypothetical protein n=1 Tax=Kitasatospora sp. NPDC058965 TaxID=3346682 RepID=UPI003692995F